MIFSGNVAGVDGRGREGRRLFQWPRQTVCYSALLELCGRVTHKRTRIPLHTLVSLPQDSLVATGTYKALCGIVHEAQLEALLVLKGLCQGVTQVVRGQGSLPTVLELGENTLKKRTRTCLSMDCGTFCLSKAFVSASLLNTQSEYVTQWVHKTNSFFSKGIHRQYQPLMHKRCMTLLNRSVLVAASSCVWRCPAAIVPRQGTGHGF